MSIHSLSIFEPMTYLAWLIIQFCLCDNSFPIIYLSNRFKKSTTTCMVNIETVPIYHKSAQSFQYVYFASISDYLKFFQSLLGINRYPIRSVSNYFGINFISSSCCFIFTFRRFSGKQYSFLYALNVEK